MVINIPKVIGIEPAAPGFWPGRIHLLEVRSRMTKLAYLLPSTTAVSSLILMVMPLCDFIFAFSFNLAANRLQICIVAISCDCLCAARGG
jgi:hypothetical protein